MGLKSREWFFGECYKRFKNNSPLKNLADSALELGFKREMTGGHILQACGAAQAFLAKYPHHKQAIQKAPPGTRYRLTGQILKDWLKFFASKQAQATYGRKEFQYNWSSLRTYLTPKYGGIHIGGGGGNDKLERVLRLVAAF